MSIKKEIEKRLKRIAKANEEIRQIRATCPHENVETTARRVEEYAVKTIYAKDFRCVDCGWFWSSMS